MRPPLAEDRLETYEATRADALLDDELWTPFRRALRSARRRVDLSQLLFEPAFQPEPFGRPLAEELEAAASRGARVRILVNENAAIPDSFDELRARFAGTPVEVRALPMTPNVMHVKLALLDDDAFLLDAPFEQRYADARVHAFESSHRRGRAPFHAVSLHLGGPVVERVKQLYDALWDGTRLPAPAVAPSLSGVQLAWTAPPGIWTAEADGGILDAYALALGRARRFVYLENQYFTSPRITEAIAAALAREPRLEVILLINEHMDVPTYDGWQATRLRELGWPDHPRLGVFTLYAPRRVASDPAARRVYIHSKVGIVDDAWATIGSANLDSISLHEADEFPVRVPRNVELNAVFADEAFAASLRRRLWGEHLGDRGVWRTGEPEGGWLAHWREIADDNAARMLSADARDVSRVVPYGALGARVSTGIARPTRR